MVTYEHWPPDTFQCQNNSKSPVATMPPYWKCDADVSHSLIGRASWFSTEPANQHHRKFCIGGNRIFNTGWPVWANYSMRFNDIMSTNYVIICRNKACSNHLRQLSFIPKSMYLYKQSCDFYWRCTCSKWLDTYDLDLQDVILEESYISWEMCQILV